RAERAIVAPNEAADRGPSHAERLEAASKIPQEVVDAANDAYEQIRLREAAEKSQAPPAPELPPPVVARPFGEN
ncbi:MAG TPA: hypothetical protein VFY71_11965, partial [Planctomycetota bacterium]|nr:hypothetical protein [Planctomycetota bacterium]